MHPNEIDDSNSLRVNVVEMWVLRLVTQGSKRMKLPKNYSLKIQKNILGKRLDLHDTLRYTNDLEVTCTHMRTCLFQEEKASNDGPIGGVASTPLPASLMDGVSTIGAANASGEALIPRRDSLYIVIPITIIYVIIFLTGVAGNVVTCIVISKNRCMHTATNYYLCSLALSDLLLLVSGLPQEVYFIWFRYPYIFSEAFCVMRGMAAETSANATVLTITAFTVERYVAICKPFRSQTMSKLSRAIKWIMVIWLVAFGFAVPQVRSSILFFLRLGCMGTVEYQTLFLALSSGDIRNC